MTLCSLLVFTLLSVAWSLWVRRLTWSSSWEIAATLNVTLQGLAVLLMSPAASVTVGSWLFSLFGQHNLEDYLGHDCYVVAASAVAFNVVGRLDGEDLQRRSFKLWVETPATLAVPIMLFAFSHSTAVSTYRPDFFRVPTDAGLTVYWVVMAGTILWLLIYGGRKTWHLRRDPRSHGIATIYLMSAGAGMLACLLRILTLFLPAAAQDTFIASFVVWIGACFCGIGFSLASAHSWRTKKRWFISAQ